MARGIQIIHRHGFTMPSGLSVNFTIGRIVSRKGKPGGESPSTGQHLPASDAPSPHAGTNCGGVGPHDCPAASLVPSFFHNGDMRHGE